MYYYLYINIIILLFINNLQTFKNVNEIKIFLINKYNLTDVKNLITYNQKLQWTKIFNLSPLRTLLVDKYLVREWVKKKNWHKIFNKFIGNL